MKIKGANCPMSAGKTTQSTLKALVDMERGKSTMIFVPTHAAAAEVMELARRTAFKQGYIVNLRGKSDDVCRPEHADKQCKRCPVFKAAFGINTDGDAPSPADGETFDVKRLREVAAASGSCALVESRRMAVSSCPKVVVASHAFLASPSTMNIVEKITIDSIIVDEADALFETLLGSNGRSIELMRSRQRKSHAIAGPCDQRCKGCVSHFADRGGKKLAPNGSRVEDLVGVSNKKNTVEMITAAIDTVELGVRDGTLHDLFNFPNIRTMVERVFGGLPETENPVPPLEYLRELEEINRASRICLDERDEDGADYAIPIDVLPVAVDAYDELSDGCEFPSATVRIAALRRGVLVDPKTVASKETAPEIETFLSFVDFIHRSPGQVYFVPQKRRCGAKRGGVEHCSLVMRYLDTRHYRRVASYLSDKTKLLSGTLLSADMVAAHLLLPREDVDLKSIDVPLHRSALIIVHNPKRAEGGKKSAEGDRKVMRAPQWLPPWAVTRFYELVYERTKTIRALHFAVNSREAGQFFRRQCSERKLALFYRVENRLKDRLEVDLASSDEEGEDQRTALLAIDKLRSSGSRALNRVGFQLCSVFGNGIANWGDRIPLYLEARKRQEGLELWDFVAYEQTRAVTQALMRAPRNSEPTVCLYAGNLHVMAFPPFLRNRIVTTEELIDLYRREVGEPETGMKAIEYQLRVLAYGISQFLEKGTLAIERTKVDVGDHMLNRWDGRRRDAEERLKHVDACIMDKGYVDRVKDRKGERPVWLMFLKWLVKEGYLREDQHDKKAVYVRGTS